MVDCQKLKNIINKRPVFILSHGSSTQLLEDRIKEFEDLDICWSGLGNFPIFETYMLSKINKHLDYVFDCSTVPESRVPIYEPIRQARIKEYLARDESNAWVTTYGIIRDNWNKVVPPKCLIVDSIFPKEEIGYFMDVPNSVTLHIASAVFGGASKIFLVGVDGTYSASHLVYYKPAECEKERMLALGTNQDPGLIRDTGSFKIRFANIYREYQKLFKNNVEIFSLTNQDYYDMIPKITINEAIKLCHQT